jgi:hypothetical protein
MNALERLLTDDVTRLLDRLAASVPDGALAKIRATTPTLAARLDQTEARLAATRVALVDDYACWRRTLDDLENIWALSVWRSDAEAPTPDVSVLAA